MPKTTIKELTEKIEALEKENEELRRKAQGAKAEVIGRMMTLLAVEIGVPITVERGGVTLRRPVGSTFIGTQAPAPQQVPRPEDRVATQPPSTVEKPDDS